MNCDNTEFAEFFEYKIPMVAVLLIVENTSIHSKGISVDTKCDGFCLPTRLTTNVYRKNSV